MVNKLFTIILLVLLIPCFVFASEGHFDSDVVLFIGVSGFDVFEAGGIVHVGFDTFDKFAVGAVPGTELLADLLFSSCWL